MYPQPSLLVFVPAFFRAAAGIVIVVTDPPTITPPSTVPASEVLSWSSSFRNEVNLRYASYLTQSSNAASIVSVVESLTSISSVAEFYATASFPPEATNLEEFEVLTTEPPYYTAQPSEALEFDRQQGQIYRSIQEDVLIDNGIAFSDPTSDGNSSAEGPASTSSASQTPSSGATSPVSTGSASANPGSSAVSSTSTEAANQAPNSASASPTSTEDPDSSAESLTLTGVTPMMGAIDESICFRHNAAGSAFIPPHKPC
ncbi:hypothetical protein CC78DRAFT_585432 [Lojkania enalia]|uniref:Uncharacterized protein n=1 Tax=Lojkania enalia TaxID=147567 RepID=A0A9P4MW86_9PLEO|nr:hypothetical protein CC78DRAFT_585432 [Didymosphaeria enalia]